MKNFSASLVVASLLLCAPSAPVSAAIGEWDPGRYMDALWDGERPWLPPTKARVYESRPYRRQAQAQRDMKLKVMKLQLSGFRVTKYEVRPAAFRAMGYVYVIVYYPRWNLE